MNKKKEKKTSELKLNILIKQLRSYFSCWFLLSLSLSLSRP